MKTLKKQKTKIILLALLSPSVSVFGQQQKHLLSFDQAMQMMLVQNPALLHQKEEIRQKEFEIKSKKELHLPTVSVSTTAVIMSEQLSIE